MPIGGGGNDEHSLNETGVDANSTSSVTAAMPIGDSNHVSLFITGTTGTHGTHVVTMQISPDGVKWFSTAHVVTGLGSLHDEICTALEVRAKITTAEGAASTIEIDMFSR